ncbi:MAG: nucleoside hydrolase [Lachnospiraceae bacterium]|nr:nucleoside hydrolase [Lachnospiraceae bacterium]MDE7176498.1 nucleoside hydrolase [Lachnospiraceae bacterium]
MYIVKTRAVLIVYLAVLTFFSGMMSVFGSQESKQQPRSYILDVDMSTDVDDVCALRIANNYHNEGEIVLKAVMSSVTGENNLKAIQGLMTYDGVTVPIGKSAVHIQDKSPYWDELAQYASDEPDVEDAVTLYRKILSSSESVNIVTTGYLTNLYHLLLSEPDDISMLSGVELVAERCEQLYVTGGSDPDGCDNNFHFNAEAAEAAKYVTEHWPAPIIFFPNNVGGQLTCGAKLQEMDTENEDPVTRALNAFGSTSGCVAWDPFAVYCAINELSEKCKAKLEPADMFIDEDGENHIRYHEYGQHYVVRFAEEDMDIGAYNEALDAVLVRESGK